MKSLACLLFLALLALPARAAEPPASALPPPAAPASEDKPQVSRHSLALADGALDYTVTVGFLPVLDERQKETARLFTVSYVAGPEAGRDPKRPVAFVFNGGPGAASAYLHLGAAGPRALVFGPDGGVPEPPARLADNPDTWLRFADLVFIDPVGTGFSHGRKDDKPEPEGEKAFWKSDADAHTLAQAVRLWLSRNQRWDSPVVLAGESYGGFRVVLMAHELVRQVGIAPSGLVLISPVLDFRSLAGGELDLLPWAFRLPALAATAAHHGRSRGEPDAIRRFALTDYPAALIALRQSDLAASTPLFETLAGFTGLPAALMARHRGRLPIHIFARELLRDQGRVVSLYDGAVSAPDSDSAAPDTRQDPFLTATTPAFTTAFSRYLLDELAYRTDLPYALLSSRVNAGWGWPDEDRKTVIAELRDLLALLPALKLLIAHGRTDLVTPEPASCWLADRLGTQPGRDCAHLVRAYDGGHMMYSRPESRRALARDLEALLAGPGAVPPGTTP